MKKYKFITVLISASLLLCIALLCIVLFQTRAASFDEIPFALRQWLNIEGEYPDVYSSYKEINKLQDAQTADISRSAEGEIYISKGSSIRSEHLFVMEIRISTITQEQFDSFDWRAQVENNEQWLRIEPLSYVYQGATLSGWGTFRLVLSENELKSNSLDIKVYGGIESSNGKHYDILRCGNFSLDIPDYMGNILPEYSLGVLLEDDDGLELGEVKSIEVSDGYVIMTINAPMVVNTPEEVGPVNDINHCLENPFINFDDGSRFSLSYGIGFCSEENYYILKELPEKYYGKTPCSIIIAGDEYQLL